MGALRRQVATFIAGIAWLGSAPLSLLPTELYERVGDLLARWTGPVAQPQPRRRMK